MESCPKNFREKLGTFFENPFYHMLLTILIVLSIFSIGYELSMPNVEGVSHIVSNFNKTIVIIFAVELLVRIIAHGWGFFKDPWHVFDFIVVFVSLISFGGYFQLFRAFRLFWLLRLVSVFPHFKHVIDAIGKAIPQMISTAILIVVMVYIFSLVGVAFFGEDHPDLYGTVWGGMSVILKSVIMPHTWSEHLAELTKTTPYAWTFVIPMIIVLNFLLLQFVIGIIVGALMRQHAEEQQENKHHFFIKWLKNEHTVEEEAKHVSPETRMMIHKIEELRQEIKELKK